MQVTTLDESRTENSHRFQRFLPDGRRFLFVARCSQRENNALYLGSLNTGKVKRLMPIDSNARYLPPKDGKPGVLVYYLEGSLVSRVLNLEREEVSGEPVPVYEGVAYGASSAAAFFSISDDGRVALIRPAGSNQSQLIWYDRNGKATGALGPRAEYHQPRISPEGNRVAVSSTDPQTGNRDLFVLDATRGAISRLTNNVANDWYPVWSPDGKQLVFASDREGGAENLMFLKHSIDLAAEETRFRGGDPADWSRDGRWITSDGRSAAEIWIVPTTAEAKPFVYLASPFRERTARFSPDGHWLAYTSDESGHSDVYVRPFTGGAAPTEGKIRISEGGGDFPVWKKTGGELYFMSRDGTIFAVHTQDLGRTPPNPARLFRACADTTVSSPPVRDASYDPTYDTIDGQRFLVNCAVERPGTFTALLNWPFAGK
jgi:Tol biopolymer transport system component